MSAADPIFPNAAGGRNPRWAGRSLCRHAGTGTCPPTRYVFRCEIVADVIEMDRYQHTMPTRLPRHALFALAALAASMFTLALHPARAAETEPPSNPERGPAKSGGVASLDELFASLDKDRDGRISQAEATGPYALRFSQWDANGDGFATRSEIHDFRLRLGIDDNGRRIANPGRSGASATPSAADKTGNTPRGPGGPRRAEAGGSAAILQEPTDWRLETMPLPPGFAPDVKITGSEEIRFAPGMFDPASSTYFTCVLAILANGAPELGAVEIGDFLECYYRGLSLGVGRRKGLSPDPAQMRAVVNPAPSGPDAKNRFVAQVVFFDSFSDGRKITLNVEARVIPLPATKRTCLILLVSPSAKDTAVWPTLREIGEKAAKNLPVAN